MRHAGETLPPWVTRLRFAEQFHLAPDAVGRTTLRSWHRWLALETAQAARAAWDRVEASGLEKATAEDKQMYNEIVLGRFHV